MSIKTLHQILTNGNCDEKRLISRKRKKKKKLAIKVLHYQINIILRKFLKCFGEFLRSKERFKIKTEVKKLGKKRRRYLSEKQ